MSLSITESLYRHLNTCEHRLWKEDRALRLLVPESQSWRGCLGLAALLKNVEQTEYPTERHALIPNDNITWVALRDIPRGHFPGSDSMNRRGVQYANLAHATLRYGMPVIDFTQELRNAWDLRFIPYGTHQRRRPSGGHSTIVARGDVLNIDEHPILFPVLNRLSAALTQFAFCAVDRFGVPFRTPWAMRRPANKTESMPIHQSQWMPRPYLAFDLATADYLSSNLSVTELRLPGYPHLAFFAAIRVARFVRDFRPVSLWWDLQPCERYINGQLETAMFPPIPLRRWNGFRLPLFGDVLLNASIADPRLRRVSLKPTLSLSGDIRSAPSCELALH